MSSFIFFLLIILPAILFWIFLVEFLSRHYFHAPYPKCVQYRTETDDGFELALYRRRPVEQIYEEPVILCHGLGANRYNLDWPGHSLADCMLEAGFDVWICELRGSGNSSRPRLFNKLSSDWTFDDILERDVPAVIAKVREITGSPKVLWAGHSMGGMLIYAHLGKGAEDVKAAFALASPAKFDNYQWASGPLKLAGLLRFFPALHQEFWGRLFAPVSGYIDPKFMRIIANPENSNGPFLRRIMANLASNVSCRIILHAARWVQTGEFISADGRINYLDRMADIRTPLGFATGSVDMLAPPDSVEAAYEKCGSEDKTYQLFGHESGYSCDYGHGDIVFGESAPEEIFPYIRDFFIERAERVE